MAGPTPVSPSLPKRADEVVERHTIEPRRRGSGRVPRPALHCPQQGSGGGVLREGEVLDADPARQRRHQRAVLAPKVDGARARGHGPWISMTSTPEPGRTRPGQALATPMASSNDVADTII